MKQSIVLTPQEVNQILVDYISEKYQLKAKRYDVNWNLITSPITITITEVEQL